MDGYEIAPEPDLPEQQTAESVAVHAGFPNPATERTGASLSLDKLLIRHPSSTYLFRIRGHHWHRYGVFDGDLAVIDRAVDAGPRDLIIWWHDTSNNFALSRYLQLEPGATVWGCVTSLIHQTGRATPGGGMNPAIGKHRT